MTNQQKLYDKVAKKLGLHKYVVENAWKSQFSLVAKTMAEGNHEAVRLLGIGTFHVLPERLKYLEEKFKQKQQDGRQEQQD